VIYVARQLGHDARLTLSTYGHVMDEFEDTPRLDAQTAIAEARAGLDFGSALLLGAPGVSGPSPSSIGAASV
jgi:hypothetical protein